MRRVRRSHVSLHPLRFAEPRDSDSDSDGAGEAWHAAFDGGRPPGRGRLAGRDTPGAVLVPLVG